MRCRAIFTLILALSLSPAARASDMPTSDTPPVDSACQAELVSAQSAVEQRFQDILAEFQALGLKHLTEAYSNGLVRVRFSGRPLFSWQKEISWHNSLIAGKRNLVVRKLDWSNEAERQRAVWAVAEALYRLEIDKRLWSVRDMFPAHLSGAMPSYNLPAVWRDSRLAEISQLEDEMYRLLEHLDQLRPEEVLPARDPARGRLATTRVFPNLQDRQLWASQGPETVAHTVAGRHARAVMFGYYLDWTKRLAVVAIVTQGIVLTTPYVVDVSRFLRTAISWVRQPPLEPSPVDRAALEQKLRLERAIQLEENRVLDPDTKKIESLQSEYRQLKARNPGLDQLPAEAGGAKQ